MGALSRLIIGDDRKNTEKRNILWNMAGSFLYALASMVLSIAVIQIAGEDAGGIFTFAYTTFGQHMFMVAYFGIRPFQITDTETSIPSAITWDCGFSPACLRLLSAPSMPASMAIPLKRVRRSF